MVKKSLQPAAKADTRSACSEEAVNATMMTGMLRGGEIGLLNKDDGADVDADDDAPLSEPGEVGSVEGVGVCAKVPILLARSIARISRAASIPDLTGS